MYPTIFVLITAFLSSLVLTFVQNDYIVKQEFAKVEYYNKSVCEYVKVKVVKPNRTSTAYTFSMHTLIDFDGELLKLNIKGFRFVNNLYNHKITDFDIKLCESFRKNYFGLNNLLKEGNLTACPIKKGYYVMNNVNIDDHRLPPFIPAGRYRTQVTLLHDVYTVSKGSMYVEIIYKVKY